MSLTLSSPGPSAPGGAVTIPITLNAASAQPAGLQWTLNYSPTNVASVNVTPGAAATAAGKAVQCNTTTGSTKCLVTGINTASIANGIVANVAFQLSPTLSATSVPIAAADAMSVSVDGASISTTALGTAIPITVSPQPTVKSLTCNLASISTPGTATCTVSLSLPAPAGGAIVTLSDDSAQLTVPANVTVPAAASSATFTATAAAVTANTNVLVTGSWNGSSASGTVALTPPSSSSELSKVTCANNYLVSGAAVVCTVELTAAALINSTVNLTDNHAQLSVASSVVIAKGALKTTFAAMVSTVTADATAQITATLNGKTASTSLSLVSATLSGISCTLSTVIGGSPVTCNIVLSKAASVDVDVTLSSSLATVKVPVSVRINAGTSSAQITATSTPLTVGLAVLTARLGAISKTTKFSITLPVSTNKITCAAATLTAGGNTTCTVTVASAPTGSGSTIQLASNNSALSVPANIVIAAGSLSGTFTASAPATAGAATVTITATIASATVSTTITIQGGKVLSLDCTPNPLTPGSALVCKVDMNPAATTLITLTNASSSTAIQVPATVKLAGTTAYFLALSQAGASAQTVRLTTTYGTNVATEDVVIAGAVTTSTGSESQTSADASDTGKQGPSLKSANSGNTLVIESLVNAASSSAASACSPGAAVTLTGKGLVSGDVKDVGVSVNGEPVLVLAAWPSRVTFQCPELPVGAPLDIVLHDGVAVSNTIRSEMQEVTPGIFSTEGPGGLVVMADTGMVNSQASPAKPGDVVSVLSTGLGRTFESGDKKMTATPVVLVDGMSAEVLSGTFLDSGVYQIDMRIPESVSSGDAVPLEIQMPTMNGRVVNSNQVVISIKAAVRE